MLRLLLLIVLVVGSSACSLGPILEEEPTGPTEILWDSWGVPHIFAGDMPNLFYAFGWAQMANHGDLLLELYGQARGRAAEYWGMRYIQGDQYVRIMGVPQRARTWYQAQSPQMRTYLDAFVAGMNAYAQTHPDQLNPERQLALPVVPEDPLAHLQRVIHLSFVAPSQAREAKNWQRAGSNAWAVAPSRSASGHAMLLANPHLPWGGMTTWFEVQLKGPGLDAYGATLVGFPLLGIAFNDHLGWTHTNNPMDGADLYELELMEGGYRWNGRVQAFEQSVDTLSGAARGWDAQGRATAHFALGARAGFGPQAGQGRSPALGRPRSAPSHGAILGHDPGDLAGPVRGGAPALADALLQRGVRRPGRTYPLPVRGPHTAPESGDWGYWQGVVPGNTAATLWTETHAYRDLPRLLDPPSGWVQNTNDSPWTATMPLMLDPENFPPYMAPGPHLGFRQQRSVRMLSEDASISFEELIEYKHSTRREMADRILDDLLKAVEEHGGDSVRSAATVLAAWDRRVDADSRGAVLFDEWAAQVRRALFHTTWQVDDPLNTPAGLANPRGAVAALERAAQKVAETHGALDVPWGEVHRLRFAGRDLPASGGPSFQTLWFARGADGLFEVRGGDSFVAVVEFSEPVQARVLLGYGNASQPNSPHRGDQLELMARQELRPVWRSRAEVEAHLARREVLEWRR